MFVDRGPNTDPQDWTDRPAPSLATWQRAVEGTHPLLARLALKRKREALSHVH